MLSCKSGFLVQDVYKASNAYFDLVSGATKFPNNTMFQYLCERASSIGEISHSPMAEFETDESGVKLSTQDH